MGEEVRKIIHIDMDCFYAAVECKHNPELRGKPLGVGGRPNSRGVLCTASYEARKFGVRSAMPSSQAARLCPNLIIVPPNFALYKKESQAVREIMERFTTSIEPLSLDEAYLDVSQSPHFNGSATRIAQEIRRLIQQEMGLTASAGVAPNKFLAKVASDWKKPNGLFVIPPSLVPDFVKKLEVGRIPGVGKVTEKRFAELGLKTCEDIQKLTAQELEERFGIRGSYFHALSFGQDTSRVHTSWKRRSLTVEETLEKDVRSLDECLGRVLPELYEDWKKRMDRSGNADEITGYVVKAKYFDFKAMTCEMAAYGIPTLKNFQELFGRLWTRRSDPVRLMGLGVRMRPTDDETVPFQMKLAF